MRVACKNRYHFITFMQMAVDDGGEGIILRKEGSLYEPGKSLSLLKVKVPLPSSAFLWVLCFFHSGGGGSNPAEGKPFFV